MKKLILLVLAATIATGGTITARHDESNIIKIKNEDGFAFFGKSAPITAVYESGDQILQKAKGVRKKVKFIFNHPKYGKLVRFEIENPGQEPTVIKDLHGGMRFDLEFDDKTQLWYVEAIKPAKP